MEFEEFCKICYFQLLWLWPKSSIDSNCDNEC